MKRGSTTSTAIPESSFAEERLASEKMALSFVPELGCHWTRLELSVKGRWLDLLAPVPSLESLIESPSGSGSYLLAPWSNRIRGASFDFGGRRHRLRPNFRDGSAIHGDVRGRAWKVVERSPRRCEAVLDGREVHDFNFPFTLLYRYALELQDEVLRASLLIENAGRGAAPVGFGFHPFVLRRLTPRDGDVILVLPAERCYPAEDCIPTGPPEPVSGSKDLRGLKALGNPRLDDCFTALTADHVRLIYPGTGCEVRIHFDSIFTHIVVYAPSDENDRPREFVAVEPVTHVNDGFNLLARGWQGTGVKVLEPGEAWGGGIEISFGDL
jgi:aldose 1-epimerase